MIQDKADFTGSLVVWAMNLPRFANPALFRSGYRNKDGFSIC